MLSLKMVKSKEFIKYNLILSKFIYDIFVGISLILVGILGIIVLFIYSVISFAVLHNYFVETDSAQLYCTTLAECMYSILRYGLLDNLGLVSIMVSIEK